MPRDVFKKPFEQILSSEREYLDKGYLTIAEILQEMDNITVKNSGLPEGLIDYRRVFPPDPGGPSGGYWQSTPPYRACWFTLGYRFPSGGFSLELGSSRPDGIYTEPKQLFTFDGLWRGKVDFFVDIIDVKYFGDMDEVRRDIQYYFTNKGFSKR